VKKFKLPKTKKGRIALTAIVLWGLVKVSLFFFPWPRYIARATWEEGKILWRRTPIEKVIAEKRAPPNELAKLALVLEARHFAVDSLGLPAGKAFTKYSRLDRDTLLLLLSAARRDTLALHRWWFPVVGWVPYKGYFDFADARAAQRDFDARGYDTDLRPASAFSTLGWFDDPLLSTSLRQDSASLANTVIHELTHNKIFVKGAVDFNESFASFVGSRGSQAFYRAHGDSGAVAIAERRWNDEQAYAKYVTRLLASLDSAYAAHPGDSAARVIAHDSVYARARAQLVDSLTRTYGDSVAQRVRQRLRLNNATLLARRVYGNNLPLFDSVYVALGGNLRATIDSVVSVAAGSEDPFQALRGLLKKINSSTADKRGPTRTNASTQESTAHKTAVSALVREVSALVRGDAVAVMDE
jgi:predicted aminopeptidase